MSDHTDRILGKIRDLELELEAEFAKSGPVSAMAWNGGASCSIRK